MFPAIMQSFTPIGATVAEISVTRQRTKKNSKLSMADKNCRKLKWRKCSILLMYTADAILGQEVKI